MAPAKDPARITEDMERWSYVQEENAPKFEACPHCGSTRGRWTGFVRVSKAVVARERCCSMCGCSYHGARVTNIYGYVDTWEAEWLLTWRRFYKTWMKHTKRAKECGHGAQSTSHRPRFSCSSPNKKTEVVEHGRM